MLRRRATRSSGPEPESLDCPPETPDNREMRDSPTAPLNDRTDQVEDHTANMSPTDQMADVHQSRSQKWKVVLIILCLSATVSVTLSSPLVTFRTNSTQAHSLPPPVLSTCPLHTANETITPVKGSTHLMVSAYQDHREGGATRIIAMVNRDRPMSLYCVLCCSGHAPQVAPAAVVTHSVHYGYPYVAADMLCLEEPGCHATHVTLGTSLDIQDTLNRTFLSIQNRERREEDFPFYLTVCMSSMFGDYNNVQQFVQTMEFYKLLGVRRVVLYLTSCGPDLEKVLQYYAEEGTLEVIGWPINHFLKPSTGWKAQELEGDIHLNGQLTIMNECIYRNMYRSRYVLLADVDQLLVPASHSSLLPLMEDLQGQHPDAAVFLMETHLFPATAGTATQDHSARRRAPGVDLLDYVYRELILEDAFRSYKMVVNPRLVLQTAMFEVTQSYGDSVRVPSDVCKIMQVKEARRESWTNEQLVLDRRLWEFGDYLVPSVDEVLQKLGIQTSQWERVVL
ncbi:uncharacterized protein LOC129845776 [Salvelinus fontinalis]|uniref:uncharacterized protein LOC129845776 n=1 Tax=Salvelinus fontinalis TaxID=8038 RepID=UPI00248526BF|nr:uncharacterized protein LOC129845776 [Salvelinus fontinalis]